MMILTLLDALDPSLSIAVNWKTNVEGEEGAVKLVDDVVVDDRVTVVPAVCVQRSDAMVPSESLAEPDSVTDTPVSTV